MGLVVNRQKKGKSVKAESTSAKPSPARRSRNEDVVPPPNLDGRTLPKVAFTGLDGDELDAQQKVVLDLGGELTDSVQEATHLVADKARRTIKLLCAVARGLPVISVGWLEACRRASTFVEDTKHIIRDKETEKKWGYSLTNSIEVARGKPLFQGKKFYITAHNKSPKLEDLKAVIEAAGGKVRLLESEELARLGSPLSRFSQVLDDIPDPGTKDKASIVILGCQEDDAFCRQLDSQGFSVQTNEYVLTGVLRQQDNPTEFKFVTGAGAVESPSKGTKRKR